MVHPELLETVRQRLVATYEPLAVYVSVRMRGAV
jgi:hypothetical protein